MKKSKFYAIIMILFAVLFAGCEESKVTDEVYADKQYVLDMSKGLQARWKMIDEDEEKEGNEYIAENSRENQQMMKNYINIELMYVEDYKNAKFEDLELQELAIKYINLLKKHLELCEYISIEWEKYEEGFESIYAERTKVIKQMVEKYDLTVDEAYQEDLDRFLVNSQLIEEQENIDSEIEHMLNNMSFELESDEYGWKTYYSIIENTTNKDFKYIEIVINLLDDEGVIVDSQYYTINDFSCGQKAKVEICTDKVFSETDASIDWYEW